MADVAVGPIGAGRVPRSSLRQNLAAFAYLIPALLVFVAFFFIPLGRSVYLSFTRSDIFGRPTGFDRLRPLRRTRSPTPSSAGSC